MRTPAFSCLLSFLFCAFAQAQMNFYSVDPPPSDFGQNFGAERRLTRDELSQSTGTEGSEGSGGNEASDGGGGAVAAAEGLLASKPFKLGMALRQGYDDNLFTTNTDQVKSMFSNLAGGINYAFGGRRLKLVTSLGAGLTYYYSRPGEKYDLNGNYELTAIYQASSRLTLSLQTTTAYLSQPDVTIVGGVNDAQGDYVYNDTTIAARYKWKPRFSTNTKYNFRAFYFAEEVQNSNQGRFEQTFSESFEFLVLPKTTLVLEYRANPVNYYEADLNSFGNFLLLGVDQLFSPRMKLSLRAGAEQRMLNNPVDGSSTYLGPYADMTYTYFFGASSSLVWITRLGTEASGVNNVSQSQSFRTGLVATHAFTPRLVGTLGADYIVAYFDQSNVIQPYYLTTISLSLGVQFKINRAVSVNLALQHTENNSEDQPALDYKRNVASIGASLNF